GLLRGPWPGRVVLLLLPVVLPCAFHYRPFFLRQVAELPSGHDLDFYIYQTTRMPELGGRWWRLGEDQLLGRPLPSLPATQPGLYVAGDVVSPSAGPGRFRRRLPYYHRLALLLIARNGWAAGWLVRRLTGSYAWAALAVVLIALNAPTSIRVSGHFHLFKFA